MLLVHDLVKNLDLLFKISASVRTKFTAAGHLAMRGMSEWSRNLWSFQWSSECYRSTVKRKSTKFRFNWKLGEQNSVRIVPVILFKVSFWGSTGWIQLQEINLKQSRNRPGVAQRDLGSLVSQISMTFGTWRWWGCQPHAPAAFNPRKYSCYSFSLGAESTPVPCYGRKEYFFEKFNDTTGNRSRDRRTSSATP
jgi:hypothetical protein